jgi:hypothetical protein
VWQSWSGDRKSFDHACNQEKTTMKMITAITWGEDRQYTKVEVPWPDEPDGRKPSLGAKDMRSSEADLTVPALEQTVTHEGQPVEVVGVTSLGIAA